MQKLKTEIEYTCSLLGKRCEYGAQAAHELQVHLKALLEISRENVNQPKIAGLLAHMPTNQEVPVALGKQAESIEWIPMSEEWPPLDKEMLVIRANDPWSITLSTLSKGAGTNPDLYYWSDLDFDDVTHWSERPLTPSSIDDRHALYASSNKAASEP